MKTSRRKFISRSLFAAAGVSASFKTWSKANWPIQPVPPSLDTYTGFTKAYPISIFSKNLQWLDYNTMAEASAIMGFDGVDLTVRPDGHVTPQKVEIDLPKAVAAIRAQGLNVYTITTAITEADDQYTAPILKTASALNIPYYRMGWMNYDSTRSIGDNLVQFKRTFHKLALLNKQYNIRGAYQNHSGTNLGAPLWDLYEVLKDEDPLWIGSQYDILHATVEGANCWPMGLNLVKSHIATIAIKDFIWEKKEGKWGVQDKPLTQGMVDFAAYFKLLKMYNIQVPVSLHYEYPLGGAENGAKTITLQKEQVLKLMKQDLDTLKQLLTNAGLL